MRNHTELDMDVCGIKLGHVEVLMSEESVIKKQPSGLLGSNVISEVRAALKERHGSNCPNTTQSEGNHCWTEARIAFEIGKLRCAKPGFARLKGRIPIHIPAQSSCSLLAWLSAQPHWSHKIS